MTPEIRAGVARRIVQLTITMAILWGLLFGAAGSLDWPRAWLCVGLSAVLLLVNTAVLLRVNPEVIAARSKRGKNTKNFDKLFSLVFALSTLAIPVVAGLDVVRFGWSELGGVALGVGVLMQVVGVVPIGWSMAVNRHLEQTVRIQDDRGHRVVTSGPYRFVRHPMYVGIVIQNIGTALLLGSAWALVPVAVLIVSLVLRTGAEDRTLHAELPGYREFAAQTRYRLLPGVW
jgi:protein-S-isoprenylcysteine O-methyltransferase Ste14